MKKFVKIFSAILALTTALAISAGCFEGNAAPKEKKFPSFATVDLAGNKVTNDIFKDKKVTAINIWGTFCPPCIEEMPELAKWADDMPKDAQIIGIVCDAKSENDKQTKDAAVEIVNNANVKFLNLLPDNGIKEYLENVSAVPTTIFVDSEGNILGDSVVGANVPKYKSRLAELLK